MQGYKAVMESIEEMEWTSYDTDQLLADYYRSNSADDYAHRIAGRMEEELEIVYDTFEDELQEFAELVYTKINADRATFKIYVFEETDGLVHEQEFSGSAGEGFAFGRQKGLDIARKVARRDAIEEFKKAASIRANPYDPRLLSMGGENLTNTGRVTHQRIAFEYMDFGRDHKQRLNYEIDIIRIS